MKTVTLQGCGCFALKVVKMRKTHLVTFYTDPAWKLMCQPERDAFPGSSLTAVSPELLLSYTAPCRLSKSGAFRPLPILPRTCMGRGGALR